MQQNSTLTKSKENCIEFDTRENYCKISNERVKYFEVKCVPHNSRQVAFLSFVV